jgi:predicted ATPase
MRYRLLLENRLVTLTGTGGAGKTRLAVELAGQLVNEFQDAVWYVDLAPVADPVVVPVTVARTMGLPTSRGGHRWKRCCDSSAIGESFWFWTTASICWMPAAAIM